MSGPSQSASANNQLCSDCGRDFLGNDLDEQRQEGFLRRADLPASNCDPCLLKPSEVAVRLAVSRSWVYAAAADGRLPSIRLGGPDGPLRFVPEDLDSWIERRAGAGEPATPVVRPFRRPPARVGRR